MMIIQIQSENIIAIACFARSCFQREPPIIGHAITIWFFLDISGFYVHSLRQTALITPYMFVLLYVINKKLHYRRAAVKCTPFSICWGAFN